jgi:hypothetical protein
MNLPHLLPHRKLPVRHNVQRVGAYSLLVMISLVRMHDSVSGLAIKQCFSYRSRVVSSELLPTPSVLQESLGGEAATSETADLS